MKKILIATHNPAKQQELSDMIHQVLPKIEIISLSTLGITTAPPEVGTTFLENAQLKAEYYAQLSRIPTLADDGGLTIDSLSGEPGIRSNRWLGRPSSDEELIEYCLDRMKNVPAANRGARFVTTLYFIDPETGHRNYSSAEVRGFISEAPVLERMHGYPYRSVFIVDQFKKNYLHLTPREHDIINHRYRAVKQLSEQLKNWYN